MPEKKFSTASPFLSTDSSSEALLSKKELAALCRVHWRTIEQWMHAKRIPYYKVGKTVRFDRRAVEKALARYLVQEVA